MNSSGKSTLTRIAEIAGIVAAIAACLALVPAFGLWRSQDNTTGQNTPPSPTQLVKRTITVAPTNIIVLPTMVTNEPTNVFIPPTSVAENTTTPLAGEERVIGGAPMVFVPAGEFSMGSSNADKDASDDEKPQHTVYLDAFWIDKFEMTNALYKKCVDAEWCQAPSVTWTYWRNPYYGNAQYENYPVTNVSWDDANAYCQWAKKRLPTEAEWEKAARGPDGRIYPWGNTFDPSRLNSGVAVDDTTAVGSYLAGASPYGAMDMAGNVLEWVADWYDPNYYANSPLSNPTGPASRVGVGHRVFRGGSWGNTGDDARFVRATHRAFNPPNSTSPVDGFRCAQ